MDLIKTHKETIRLVRLLVKEQGYSLSEEDIFAFLSVARSSHSFSEAKMSDEGKAVINALKLICAAGKVACPIIDTIPSDIMKLAN